MFKNKKGSIYVEASLVMPAACLICIALIYITMFFYTEIRRQVDSHAVELEKWSEKKSSSDVRSVDKMEDEFYRYNEKKVFE